MNWNQKVDQSTKHKVQKLIANFENYLYQVHSPQEEIDQQIIRKWKCFKEVIQKEPNDPAKLHAHLNKMAADTRKTNKSEEITATNTQSQLVLPMQFEGKKIMNQELSLLKSGLRQTTRSFLKTLLANNRAILRC